MRKIVLFGIIQMLSFLGFAQSLPNDCVNAITVCGNGTFASNASGIGSVQEVSGCGGSEHNSLWIRVNVIQSGTLGFNLIPNNTSISVDYDFWVYAANAQCGNLGAPIRCCTTNPAAAGASNNHTGMNGNTLVTQSGPGASGNGYVRWLTVTAGQFYYIAIDRPIGNGGFSIEWTGTATAGDGAFASPPSVNELGEVRTCSSTPNVGIFNLDALRAQINADTGRTSMDFYTTLQNAIDGVSPLDDIISNTSNPQTIYVKVIDDTTGCYSLTDFTLAVYPLPNASVSVSPSQVCAGATATVSFSGTPNAVVYYSVNSVAIQSVTLNNSGVFTLNQAFTQDSTIVLQNVQIVTSDGSVVCDQPLTGSATVTVNAFQPFSVSTPSPICVGENVTLHLTGEPNAIVQYYTGTNSGNLQSVNLDSTGNYNLTFTGLTASTSVTFVDMTATVAPNCTLQINQTVPVTVSPFPTANTNVSPYAQCDNGTGSATFTLSSKTAEVTNNNSAYGVTYYASMTDAQAANTNTLPNSYTTIARTIYALVKDIAAGCSTIVSFPLQVLPIPTLSTITPLGGCEETGNTATFNLTASGPQSVVGASGYTFTYYTTQTNAINGTTAGQIATPSAYVSGTGSAWVAVAVTGSSCHAVGQIPLVVHNNPVVGTLAPYSLCDDPSTTGNIATFNLTTKNTEANGGDTTLTVSYYTSLPAAQAGTGAITNPTAYNNTASPQTIYVRVVNSFGCYSTGSFVLTVNPLPSVNTSVTPYQVCDNGSGQAVFTLSSKDAEITNNNAGYTVTYYSAMPDAQAGNTNTLPNNYQSANTTVYARVTDNTTGCFTVVTLQLRALSSPVLSAITPLSTCAVTANTATFNLSATGSESVGGATGYVFSYYTTQASAIAGGTAGQINNITGYSSTTGSAWVRVEVTGSTTGCYAVGEIPLTVYPKPVIPAISNYVVCDTPAGTGIVTFDLTTKNAEATTNPLDIVTYYTSLANAESGTSPITNPSSFNNTTAWNQNIWVRVQDQLGCWNTQQISLVVNLLPQVNSTSTIFYACEEVPGQGLFNFTEITAVIVGGRAYTVTYYISQPDATAGASNNITANPYLSTDAVIYARITDTNTSCVAVVPITLQVESAPIAPQPQPVEVCDDNNDGVAVFDLTSSMQWIVNQMGGSVTTSVHETLEDASFLTGTNPIANPSAYINVQDNTQTVYIRVSSPTTSCFDVVPLQLIVNPRPVATDPLDDYLMCDNGADDTDGIAIFDLTTYQGIVLNTMSASQYSVSYYTDEASAILGTPAISTPATYTSVSGTVFIRVTNNVTGCYDIVPLNLVVNPLPVANQPQPYSLCDVNNPGDEREIFDLTSVTNEITGGVHGLLLSYYHTLLDAQAGNNAISNPAAYQNRATVESIFVRVEDEVTHCYRIVLLDVRVEPLPQLTPPTTDELTVCDTDGSGYGTFDLDALTTGMVNNGTNITLAFYHTVVNATAGINPITNTLNYQNIIPFGQTIYVVATNTVTGCQSLPMAITLIVSPAPVALPVGLQNLIACDDNDSNGQDNQMVFDLTVQNATIETQLVAASGSLTIHYFTSEANAEAGTPRITVPQSYTGSNGQVIWVRIEYPGSGCYQVSSFTLHINQPVLPGVPAMLTLCDEDLPNDETTIFNLRDREDEILTPFGIGSGNVVEYFATQLDLQNNIPITNPEAYSNSINPQTLPVRITTPQGCESFTWLTIRVAPLPTPNISPVPLEECDENNIGDGLEAFDLTQAANDIRNNASNVQLSYYTTEAAAWAGDTLSAEYISNPAAYTNTTAWTDSVWVRVTLTSSLPNDPACARVVALQLIVNPMPQILDASGNVPFYAICNRNSTGTETFNLIDHINNILMQAGAAPADYTIRFYFDQTAYNAGRALPNVYTNTVPYHQPILVYIENNATGCFLLKTLDLYAEPSAVANSVAGLTECDYYNSNDGYAEFDLTVQTPAILGGQLPADFSVAYYTDVAAAWANDTTSVYYIANPSTFVNTTNPQTVYAVVTNLNTVSPCRDVTSFNVNTELLAEPVIETLNDNHTICVDFYTNNIVSNPLVLTATDVTVNWNDYSFTWYKDGVDVTINPSQYTYVADAPGLYTVVATSNMQGCVSDTSATFEVLQSGPASRVNDSGYVVSNAFGNAQTVTVLTQGYGEYQYCIVKEGEEPLGPWQNSNVFADVAGGYFDIYVRDIATDNPCDMVKIPGVSVIDYPRFFTPNGDGFNDYWNITGLDSIDPSARIFIFDRYGKLIKQLSPASRADHNEGWDGTFNGKLLPSDDYWFTVEFTEGGIERTFKAHFAMKR